MAGHGSQLHHSEYSRGGTLHDEGPESHRLRGDDYGPQHLHAALQDRGHRRPPCGVDEDQRLGRRHQVGVFADQRIEDRCVAVVGDSLVGAHRRHRAAAKLEHLAQRGPRSNRRQSQQMQQRILGVDEQVQKNLLQLQMLKLIH